MQNNIYALSNQINDEYASSSRRAARHPEVSFSVAKRVSCEFRYNENLFLAQTIPI